MANIVAQLWAKLLSRDACPHIDFGKRIAPESTRKSGEHLAFTCCGELNLNGMIDAQVTVLESER